MSLEGRSRGGYVGEVIELFRYCGISKIKKEYPQTNELNFGILEIGIYLGFEIWYFSILFRGLALIQFCKDRVDWFPQLYLGAIGIEDVGKLSVFIFLDLPDHVDSFRL